MHFQLKIVSTYDGFMGLLGHNPILHGGRSTLECPEGLQYIGASESLMTEMTSILGSVSFNPNSFLNIQHFFPLVCSPHLEYIYRLKLMQGFSVFFS